MAGELGYLILSGPEIDPGERMAEREDYGRVILERRVRQALQRLNPQMPSDTLDEAVRKLTQPDVVLFINGLPVGVIDLKNPATETATIWSALNQLQTYKSQIPSLFASNEAMVISDGVEARMGTSSKLAPSRNCWTPRSGNIRTGPLRRLKCLRS